MDIKVVAPQPDQPGFLNQIVVWLRDYGRYVLMGLFIGAIVGFTTIPKSHKRPHHSFHWCKPNVTVSAAGGSDHTTILAAVQSAPLNHRYRYCIYIREGRYAENIQVRKERQNIMFLSDDWGRTIITSDRICGDFDDDDRYV